MARGTKELIYRGALEAFAELGFTGTSMDLIAEKSGVVKRTLYYNFQTKEELFAYVMKRGIDELTTLLDHTLKEEVAFHKKWENVVQAHLHYYQENTYLFHLLIQQMWKRTSTDGLSIQQLFRGYFERLDLELSRDKERGDLEKDLDVFTLSASLFGLITIPAARSLLNGQAVNLEAKQTTIRTLILQILGGK